METQGLSTDRISTLPQSLIENILCLVPIKDAVRTSVLSREWRSKWTTIPKLVFSEYSFDLSNKFNKVKLSRMKNTDPLYMERQRKMMSRKCKLFYAIFQVLSVHQGPIHEFGLSTDGDATYVEVDQIIVGHLARNSALKKLTLDLATRPCYYKVPLSFFSFFSLHHLTELDLSGCHITLQPASSPFRSLTRLCLNYVKISTKELLNLVSRCPLLTSFSLLENCEIHSDHGSTLMELFKCLPMIEDLTISNRLFQFWWWSEDLYSKGLNGLELRTSLDHLQCFRVEDMYFTCRMDLVFILSVIKCSPNLEKFKLHMFGELKESEWNSRTEFVTHEDYPDIWLENLNELEIFNFGNSKQELDLVKLILANSPMLKKLSLFPYRRITKDEEMSLLEILLHSPRASPMVEQLIVKK